MDYNRTISSVSSRVFMGKSKVTKSVQKTFGRAAALLALVILAIPASGFAHEIPKTEETEALLSKEASAPEQTEEEPEHGTIIYHWIGGRLDRVTVERQNGLQEVYQNTDSRNNIWNADETELGHMQNVRQWRLGSW